MAEQKGKGIYCSSVLQGLPSLSQMLVRFDTEQEKVEQGFGLNVHLVRESCGFLQNATHPQIFPRPSAPGLTRRLQLELRPHANRLEVGGF